MDALRNLMTQAARLSGEQRLYQLSLPAAPDVVVEQWHGQEQLSQGFRHEVTFLSLQADLPLETWLGARASLRTRLADGATHSRTGVVTEAHLLGADGGLARYRITLCDASCWLAQTRHSRVFQDQTLQQIVDSVFAAHQGHVVWRWSEEVADFLKGARQRSYCVQYRESDLDFVQRLLAEEGLGWRVQPDEDDGNGGGHALVLFADSGVQPQDAVSARSGGIRFHRADGTEQNDAVQALGQRRQLGAQSLSLHSDDYRTVRSLGAGVPLDGGGSGEREVYDPTGAYAFVDRHEADRYAGLMAQACEARWNGWQGRSTVRSATAGHWLQLCDLPGDAPAELLLVSLRLAGINNLPADARDALEAALGPAVQPDADAAPLWDDARRHGFAATFSAVARDQVWRPILQDETGARLNPRPLAPGYQTAVVVGDASRGGGPQEVHADGLGRVRVRFHFQVDCRDAGTAQDSTWLRVAQRYAGPGVGSQFLPRVGQEVLVGFLEGDIDRPVVVGSLYNGQGEAGVAPTPGGKTAETDTRAYAQATDRVASAQGNRSGGQAPAWHAAAAGDDAHRHPGALWGVQSREWSGDGHSRLLFDDSDAQLRLQLATTQASSALTLGHLIHQADNFRGSLRGEGFELRTDAWGSLRSRAGLWLSAYAGGAASPAGTVSAPVALLSQLKTLGTTFAQAAGTHLTVKLASAEGVGRPQHSKLVDDAAPLDAVLRSARATVPGDTFADARAAAGDRDGSAGEGRVPHVGDPLLGLAAPGGVLHRAGQSIHWSLGETLTLGSGLASETIVLGQSRWHSRQAIGVLAAARTGQGAQTRTLSMVAGLGVLDVQAQNDSLRVQSKAGLRAASAQAAVELAAGRTVHVATAGGASVTIEGGNITFTAPGNITVHAAKKSFLPGGSGNYPLPVFPQSVCKECLLLAAQRAAPLTPKG
jgi:type VI secretion system VgrG family protein